MRESYAKELGLLYDKNLVISINNCTFWPEVNLAKNFPDEGELCMVAFSCGIPYGSGAAVLESFDDLTIVIDSPDDSPSILNGKPAPGIADTLRALEKNEFNSFYGIFLDLTKMFSRVHSKLLY